MVILIYDVHVQYAGQPLVTVPQTDITVSLLSEQVLDSGRCLKTGTLRGDF